MEKQMGFVSPLVPSTMLKLMYVFVAILVLSPTDLFAGEKKQTGQVMAPTGFRGIPLPKWPHNPVEIQVTDIEDGSPSSGSGLKPGDVIVGFGSELFKEDPRQAMAKAIDIGEAAGGTLTLLLKTGKKVDIKLANLGSYSATAPYNCPKSEKIIEQTVKALLKSKNFGSSVTHADLLALMATGDKAHLEIVAKRIHGGDMLKVDPKKVDEYLITGAGMGSTGWTWGYNLILLGEYYLLTKDEAVLPAMRTYALGLARGQDAIGLWGHRMATVARNGRAAGYGIMNQNSLSNFLGMIIAEKCGIKDPVLDKAIEKTYAYVADHVDKGGFPYGVHGPAKNQFNNNGSSASAAICMSLKGNQHGASYFSQVSAATHNKLGLGHASSYFNPLWTPLGASLSGPEVTHEFFKRSMWFFNGKRHWKGGFSGGDRVGSHAAQALLMYCLPRKALLITGREADESIWIKGDEVAKVIMRSQTDYKSKSANELLQMFNDPIIQVRVEVAGQLARKLAKIYQYNNKDNKPDPITPKILALINNGNERERITGLDALGKSPRQVAEPHAKLLAEIIRDKEEALAVRVAAVSAIGDGNCRAAAIPYYNDILRFTLEERSEADPFGHVDKHISRALIGMFTHLKTPESKKDHAPDKELLYKVARKFLEHKRQNVRGAGIKMLQGITLKDFHIVADDLMDVLENKAPDYHTYSSVLNRDGIGILADLNIKEGLDLLEEGIFNGGGKWGFKYGALISALPRYGANAKPYILKFEAHPSINKKGDRFTPQWQAAVKKIENDKHPKKLMTAEEAKKIGNQ